jgi:hypothetical protein
MLLAHRGAAALAFVAALAPGLATAERSIVGVWYPPGGGCSLDDGGMTIGPKSLVNQDVSCTFSTVRRRGSTVTWRGICDGAEGANEQTVTATERNGQLTIRFSPGGNVIPGYRRCE